MIVKENLFYCNVSVNGNNKIAPHTIDYYDLTFVLNGKLTYIIDGTKYILEENDALLLRPGTLRERLAGNTLVKYVSFNFLLNEDIELGTFLKGTINSDIRKLISLFPHGRMATTPHFKEKIESTLNYILYELIDVSTQKTSNMHITKILNYIEKNISKSISLSDISKEANLSKEYTANLFKKEMEQTIIEYTNERKMTLAKSMIDNGEYSLSDVAYALGFDNYSYFSKVFKKHYGISPIKFKNR